MGDETQNLRDAAVAASERCPGRWAWSGTIGRDGPGHYGRNHNSPRLACWAPGRGEVTVMDFERLGMRSAGPRFIDAESFAMESGRKTATYEQTYRDEITGFANPAAAWIAAASPDAVLALFAELDRLTAENERLRSERDELAQGDAVVLENAALRSENERLREALRETARLALTVHGLTGHWSECPAPPDAGCNECHNYYAAVAALAASLSETGGEPA